MSRSVPTTPKLRATELASAPSTPIVRHTRLPAPTSNYIEISGSGVVTRHTVTPKQVQKELPSTPSPKPIPIPIEEGSYICVDPDRATEMASLEEESHERPPIVIDSLLDIARPARTKGVARDYEIIPNPPRVIVLEEEPEDPSYTGMTRSKEGDDDWEEVPRNGEDSKREKGNVAKYYDASKEN